MSDNHIADHQRRDYERQAVPVDDEIDLLAIFRTLWRGKWVIGLVTSIAIVLGVYYAFGIAIPKYTATAVVALESRQENVVDLESVMSGLGGDQISINTEIEVLRSRGLIAKLVARMALQDDPEFNPSLRPEQRFSIGKLIGVFAGHAQAPIVSTQTVLDSTVNTVLEAVSISNLRQSYAFTISVVTTNPEKSAAIANTLAELYILDQIEVKFAATEQATIWLSERVAVLQEDLETAEAAVQVLSGSTELVSAEALEAVNRQIKETRDRLADVDSRVISTQARVNALIDASASSDRVLMAAIASDRALDRLLETKGDNTAFMAQFNAILLRARNDLDRARAQSSSLAFAVSTLETDFAVQSADLAELQQLQREAEASGLIYEYFLGRLKETSVQEGIQQADSRVLSPAAVPIDASEPRKPIILALCAILGLMLGAGGMLLREMLQVGFRTTDELEAATGLAVMGQIPRIQARRRDDVLKHLLEKPTSAAAEAVRNLRTSILLSDLDNPPKVILVTSSVPSEGKTTSAIALAQNFAGLGKRVLLIEGDLRRRVYDQYFNLQSQKGLLSVVSGDIEFAEAVQRSDLMSVDIIIAEKSSANPADVFSSIRFREFINRAREQYDIVIIDTPPVLVVPDARVLAQVSDVVMYAVAWDRTSRHQVSEGLKQFETGSRRVTGLILGQIDPKGMRRYGYSDRYGAYSSYGKGYFEA